MEQIIDILQWIEENSVPLEEFENLIGPELPPTEDELQAALEDLFPDLDERRKEEDEVVNLIAEYQHKICHIFWIEGIMFSRERETFFEIMGE